ncbi:Cysteine-rich repeat secretory protein, partial [Quillaja saponaria]
PLSTPSTIINLLAIIFIFSKLSKMSSSVKLIASSFLLLTFAFLLQTSLGANPLFHFCSNPKNFTTNSPYYGNLKTLISFLNHKTPATGFGLSSVGQYQNQAHGLALCRGDVSSSDCKTCVKEASSEILKRCQYNKGAIIWYDNCLFKYLDEDFLGQIDTKNKFYYVELEQC